MESGIGDALQLVILVILLFLSSFFSSAETAFTTVNRVRLRSLSEEGNLKAKKALKVLEDHSRMLTSILIGNNIVNLSASALTTSLVLAHFNSLFVGVSTFILTTLILIFGEIVPKRLAAAHAEEFCLKHASILWIYILAATPLCIVANALSALFLMLIRAEAGDPYSAMTEEDLKSYVDVGHEDGAIESDERELIYNVFDFSDATAKDVMIPRVDMVTAQMEATYTELMEIFRENMYTRIPIYDEDPDKIVGMINVKDFLLVEDRKGFSIRDILREAYYTHEFKKIDDLLTEMRERAVNVCFVLNEYGATVGMITMEDLLEELVGELRDEYDHDEDELIHKIYDNQYLIASGMKLDDINDALGTDFDSEHFDSLGGIIIEKLDRIPEDNDCVTLDDNTVLKVRGVNDNRIDKVLLILPEKEEKGTEEKSS